MSTEDGRPCMKGEGRGGEGRGGEGRGGEGRGGEGRGGEGRGGEGRGGEGRFKPPESFYKLTIINHLLLMLQNDDASGIRSKMP